MSQGQDQVRAALEICRDASQRVAGLTGAEEHWRAEATGRLERVEALLRAMMDKFFLRTKLCVPFTARCAREARRMDEALRALEAAPGEGAQQGFDSALATLEKSAKALESRSAMRGMAIT